MYYYWTFSKNYPCQNVFFWGYETCQVCKYLLLNEANDGENQRCIFRKIVGLNVDKVLNTSYKTQRHWATLGDARQRWAKLYDVERRWVTLGDDGQRRNTH
ncbi:hypothetical protein ANAPC5_01420 [Anaplasma phagocytophilum]|nr:hypothetical protein ANAPC5_01420 [Anaplasma phagocytophilum]